VGDAEDEPPTVAKISMQRVSGSIRDLLEEFDVKWPKFAVHHYWTRQQQEYIKKIKEEAHANRTVAVQMDFAENHSLIVQHEIQQAHWTTPQATIFTVHVTVDKTAHYSLAFISDHLDHDVDFLHAAQGLIVQFILHRYPTVKRVNYITDGAPQHFKSNRSMLNLTHHESDFGIPATWTFSATAYGKAPVDGIGAALKYRATRRVLSGRREDTILTPKELYQFASTDTKINVFYLSRQDIKQNSESMNLSKRLTQKAVKGQIILPAIDKRFPSFFGRLDSRNPQYSSIRSFGSESCQLSYNIQQLRHKNIHTLTRFPVVSSSSHAC
jgi:hypothetical protein